MKALIAAFLIAIAAPLAHAGVTIQHWLTANGTPVYFVQASGLPILDVQIDFAAGSLFDPPGKAGLAGLTRGLVDLGAGRLSENAIADQLADVGARIAGGADMDRASISLRTLSAFDKRTPAIELLRLVLQSPRFEPTVFDRERSRSAAALKDALTRPDSIAGRAFWQALYPDHPYGRQATPESIGALTVADVRAFHHRYYTARNATLSMVGDLSRGDAEKLAETLAAAMPPGETATLPAPPAAPPGSTVKLPHPATQAHIYLGLPAIERGHPDFFPLVVGNYTLGGGGFMSRLMREVRDKRGYAYGVYSYFSPMRQPGPFQIALQTKRSQAGEALQLTRALLEEFLAKGPSEEELAAAKANLTGSFPLRLDNNRKILDNVAAIAFYRLPLDYLDTYQSRINAVTAEQVRAAFARHVRGDRLITVVVAGD